MKDKNVIAIFLSYILVIIAVSLVSNKFLLDIIVLTFLWAFLAQAWNIAGGYSGQFSLGHCAFFGVGAYTSTILYLNHGISPWLGMLMGGVVASLLAAVLSAICNRLKGHFFALATLAFGQILYISSIQLKGVTRGTEGLHIPFEPGFANMIFDSRGTYACIIITFALVLTSLTYFLQRSKFGLFLYAIRDNEVAALSLGVRGFQLKILSFALSAFFTALGGTFYAQYILFIDPDSTMILSIAVQIAIIAIIGGTGSYLGPLLGAFVLIPASMVLRAKVNFISGLDILIYGVILIIVVLFLPDGLLALIVKLFKRKGNNNFSVGKERKEEVKCNVEL